MVLYHCFILEAEKVLSSTMVESVLTMGDYVGDDGVDGLMLQL